MRADVFLAAAEVLPFGGLSDLLDGAGLVVVAPHPDDESLGCAGLIAAACAQGVAVQVVVISDGCGSHPNSRRYPAEKLRALREAETLAAVAELGVSADAVRFVRLPDGKVATTGPQAETACMAIVAAANACRARTICVTWRHDPHCDHEACAALVETVRPSLTGVRIWAYPIWGWTLPPETPVIGEPHGLRLDISGQLSAKQRAVAAHRSQTTSLIDDDPGGFRLDAAMLERFARPYEIFLDVQPLGSGS